LLSTAAGSIPDEYAPNPMLRLRSAHYFGITK